MILHLTDSDVFAGTERHIADLALGLVALGVPVGVCCPVPSPLAERAASVGATVIPLPKRGQIDFKAVAQLAALYDAGQVRLIHAHNGRSALHAALAKRRAHRTPGVPPPLAIMTQHFLRPARVDRRGPKGWVGKAIHRFVHRHLDHVVAISDAVAAEALARRDVPPDRLTVVHNGLSAQPPARSPAAVRAEFGLAEGEVLLLCTARLEVEKDIATLIDAVRIALPGIPTGQRCIVAGTGSLKAELTARIAAAGLERQVILAGFRDDVADLLGAADLFVLPARAEPFGLALLEAMAAGLPVLATNAGGPIEIVTEGETGHLFPPGDAPQLATLITRLATDPALRQRQGQAGRARYLDRFTVGRMSQNMLHLYQRLGAVPGSLPITSDGTPHPPPGLRHPTSLTTSS